jgi:DnaJ-class molecular chaperone
MIYDYDELQEAVEFFGLIGLENQKKIKQIYLKLSKQYHPDISQNDQKKFQQLNKYYKILNHYIDNFQFRFTKEEFEDQYPFAHAKEKQMYGAI